MKVDRKAVFEAQKKSAADALAARKAVLVERKLDDKAQKRDAQFRKFKALIKKVDGRLKALEKVEGVKADLATRAAERAARPKVKKEKKKKVVAVKTEKPKRERKGPPSA